MLTPMAQSQSPGRRVKDKISNSNLVVARLATCLLHLMSPKNTFNSLLLNVPSTMMRQYYCPKYPCLRWIVMYLDSYGGNLDWSYPTPTQPTATSLLPLSRCLKGPPSRLADNLTVILILLEMFRDVFMIWGLRLIAVERDHLVDVIVSEAKLGVAWTGIMYGRLILS